MASDLDLTVVDAATIDAAADAARRLGKSAAVHLKVDTGMRRIGCPPEQAPGSARAVLLRIDSISAGVFGVVARDCISATTPATCGAAIEVPLYEA